MKPAAAAFSRGDSDGADVRLRDPALESVAAARRRDAHGRIDRGAAAKSSSIVNLFSSQSERKFSISARTAASGKTSAGAISRFTVERAPAQEAPGFLSARREFHFDPHFSEAARRQPACVFRGASRTSRTRRTMSSRVIGFWMNAAPFMTARWMIDSSV